MSALLSFIVEPLQYGFVVRGLLAGILAAIACSSLSGFVVWRGMAFVGDALPHAILPGIVVAYALGMSLFAGALVASVVAVAGIGWLARGGRLKEDTAIGVVFAGLFALGIFLLSRVASYQDLGHILFGNILGVTRADLVAMGVVVTIVVVLVAVSFKELLVTSFDPAHAVAIGLSPDLLRYGLLLVLALTTVVVIQTVGVVLVLALLVTPGAAASLLSRRFEHIIGFSLIISVGANLIGFYVSYYLNVASGASIVLVLTLLFLVARLFCHIREARGNAARPGHTRKKQSTIPAE